MMVPIRVVELDKFEEFGFTIRGTSLLVKYLIWCRILRHWPGMDMMLPLVGAPGVPPGMRAFL